MTLAALRDDALSSTADGFALRLSLPWIRSLPLASLDAVEVVVDGERVDRLGDRPGRPPRRSRPRSPHERGWWFLQDRVVLRGARMLRPGVHDVAVSFRLVIPYLQVGAGRTAHPAVPNRPVARARCRGVLPVRLPRCRLTGKEPM